MSYVSQQFLLRDNATLANFKNWAQAISTAMASMGWVQTSDTGQVNWSTIVAVGTVYEIWAPADALQTGSTAFFLKIVYGNAGANNPQISVSLAHSTDGAGNLQAPVVGPFVTNGSSGQGSTRVCECNFSGDIDRLSINMWRDSTDGFEDIMFSIERTKDTAGVNSTDGVTIYINFPNNARQQQGTLTFSPLLVFSFGALCRLSMGLADAAFNNNIPISPLFPVYGKFGNPNTGVALCPANDVAEGGIFTATLYGATRTYLASKRNTYDSQAICVRFD